MKYWKIILHKFVLFLCILCSAQSWGTRFEKYDHAGYTDDNKLAVKHVLYRVAKNYNLDEITKGRKNIVIPSGSSIASHLSLTTEQVECIGPAIQRQTLVMANDALASIGLPQHACCDHALEEYRNHINQNIDFYKQGKIINWFSNDCKHGCDAGKMGKYCSCKKQKGEFIMQSPASNISNDCIIS